MKDTSKECATCISTDYDKMPVLESFKAVIHVLCRIVYLLLVDLFHDARSICHVKICRFIH